MIGDYRLGRELGRGGFGVVFEALNVRTGETVACKRIPLASSDEVEHEVQLLRRLKHVNIVRYMDSLRRGGELYIVTELVEKGSLLQMIKSFGVCSETLAAVYCSQILAGLEYLHEQGVVHHDIKAANVLSTKDGVVKLADFGVAAMTSTEVAAGVEVAAVGSPYWLAPEVVELTGGGPPCDIWSLGCTILELMTGAPPYFNLSPMAAMFHIVQDEVVPLPEGVYFTPALLDFLAACFRKDTSFRATAAQLRLHPWITAREGGLDPPTPQPPVARPVVNLKAPLQVVADEEDDFDSMPQPVVVKRLPPAQMKQQLAAFIEEEEEGFKLPPTAALRKREVEVEEGEETWVTAVNLNASQMRDRLAGVGRRAAAPPVRDDDWDVDAGPTSTVSGGGDPFAELEDGLQPSTASTAAAEALKAAQRMLMALAEMVTPEVATRSDDGAAFDFVCARIVRAFRETPALKSHFVRAHGALALMDILTHTTPTPSQRALAAALRVLNALLDASPDEPAPAHTAAAVTMPGQSLHDTLCLIGVVPVVLAFAAPTHSSPVRAAAAAFMAAILGIPAATLSSNTYVNVKALGSTASSRTVLIASGGIHALVALLTPSARPRTLGSAAASSSSSTLAGMDARVTLTSTTPASAATAAPSDDFTLTWALDDACMWRWEAVSHPPGAAAMEVDDFNRWQERTLASAPVPLAAISAVHASGTSTAASTLSQRSAVSITDPLAAAAAAAIAADDAASFATPVAHNIYGTMKRRTMLAAAPVAGGDTHAATGGVPTAISWSRVSSVPLSRLARHFITREAIIARVALHGIGVAFSLGTLTMAANEFRRLFLRAGVLQPLTSHVRNAFAYVCTQCTRPAPTGGDAAAADDPGAFRGYGFMPPSTTSSPAPPSSARSDATPASVDSSVARVKASPPLALLPADDDDDMPGMVGFRSDLRLSSTSSAAGSSVTSGTATGSSGGDAAPPPVMPAPAPRRGHAHASTVPVPSPAPAPIPVAAPMHTSAITRVLMHNLELGVDALATFTGGDAPIKVVLSSPTLIQVLLRLLRPAPYALLHMPDYTGTVVRALKALKALAMEPAAIAIMESAIHILVPFLLRETGLQATVAVPGGADAARMRASTVKVGSAARGMPAAQATIKAGAPTVTAASALHSKDIQSFVLQTLFYICRVNKARQTAAAVAGIIPVLQHVIQYAPGLKPLALPIMCDLAHASDRARALLHAARAVHTYVSLLSVDYWHSHAIRALADWASQPGEAARLGPDLSSSVSIAALTAMFVTSTDTFATVLKETVTLCEKMPPVALSLSRTDVFMKEVLSRLTRESSNAASQRYLLALIRAMWDAREDKAAFAAAYQLVASVQAIDARANEAGRVMVQQVSAELLARFKA